ncbi:MAG: hypothetical protein NC821_06175, partial [Candidatus Omnitrophica bacterium]|nr:hypothetical protein [Candidatus Omnitrophota bacterium]
MKIKWWIRGIETFCLGLGLFLFPGKRDSDFFFQRENSLRRIRRENFLIKSEAIPKLLRPYVPSLKVAVLDREGTVSELAQGLPSQELILELIELMKKGLHIALVTGASFEDTQKYFFSVFPRDFKLWKYLHLYSDMGAIRYDFEENGNPVMVYKKEMNPKQRSAVEKIAGEFEAKYKNFILEIAHRSATGNITIRFNPPEGNTREKMQDYLEFLKKKIIEYGIPEIIIGTSPNAVTLSVVDKYAGINNLRNSFGFQAEEMLIVGDGFSGEYAVDGKMAIPGALVINVGPAFNLPPNVFTLEEKGPLGTFQLLKRLNREIVRFQNIAPVKTHELRKMSYRSDSVYIGENGFGLTRSDRPSSFIFTVDVYSCIVLTLYDPKTTTALLTHLFWGRDGVLQIDQAFDFMLAKLRQAGVNLQNVEAGIYGGERGNSEILLYRLYGLLEENKIKIKEQVVLLREKEKAFPLAFMMETKEKGEVFILEGGIPQDFSGASFRWLGNLTIK